MNNYAYGWSLIYFINYKHKCEESNLINNSQGTNNYGTFDNWYSAITTINKCCILNNNAIGSGIYLFYVDSGTIYVKGCTIQSGYNTKGSVILTNNVLLNFYNFIENVKKCHLLFVFSNVEDINEFKNTICDFKNCEDFFLDKLDEIFKTLFGNIVINSIS
jgi:hypothetical protein